jgi:hypothetical protein
VQATLQESERQDVDQSSGGDSRTNVEVTWGGARRYIEVKVKAGAVNEWCGSAVVV